MMPTRTRLLRLAVGPELLRGGALRFGRSQTGQWSIQNHQGQILAMLYTPGIPDDEVHLREDSLGLEIVWITE